MQSNDAVLVVGSGPTGLIMAIQLTLHGVPIRLIDRLPTPITTSRAFTVHARTLELLEQMGLAKKFLSKSIKTYSMDYHFPRKDDVPKLDFRELDSVYPFCLTINQADTEEILRNYLEELGVSIEWDTELTWLDEQENGRLLATLKHHPNRNEEAIFDWVLGCDGIASAVRRQMRVALDGTDYGGTMRMIDVNITGFEHTDEAIHYFIAKDHMLLINKLPGVNHRVLISDKSEGVPADQARAAFQATLDRHFKGQVQLGEPVWSTNFKISKRKVNTYSQGNIFLAGDSAHVNSPAGGQGMNVAIQDAFNLGWKLAMVLKKFANASLLDTYETERSPIASQMLEGTNYIHSIIMAHGKGMKERIERMKGGEWNRQAVNQIAGISYTYRDENSKDNLATGDRAPDAMLTDEQRIYNLFPADGYTLLAFAGLSATQETVGSLATQVKSILSKTKAPMKATFILPEGVTTNQDNAIIDSGAFHEKYNSTDGQFVLVRPDCHIACIGSADEIKAHLQAHFLPMD